MSFLKPKTKATATNTNNALLTSTYSPSMQQGVGAQNFLGSLLMGTGDTGAANAGWDQYKSNAGYETRSAISRAASSAAGQLPAFSARARRRTRF